MKLLMSERYIELYKLNEKFYQKDCSVFIDTGVLYKDTKKDEALIQLKLVNVGNKIITACKVQIKTFEINGNQINETNTFSYLDLKVAYGNYFGPKIPIYLSNNIARKFIVLIEEIVYSDGSIWSKNNEEILSIPKREEISSVLKEKELIQQYSIECNTDMHYLPLMWENLFFCGCGAINYNSNICYRCKANYKTQNDNIKIDYLRNKANLRRKNENQLILQNKYNEAVLLSKSNKIEDIEKGISVLKSLDVDFDIEKQIEIGKKNIEHINKKIKKRIIVTIMISIMTIILGVAIKIGIDKYKQYANKLSDYNLAQNYYNEGEYTKAADLYNSLGKFKDASQKANDSIEMYKSSKYDEAINEYNQGDFNSAIAILSELVGYKDSDEYLSKAYEAKNKEIYERAISYYEEGNYYAAIVHLKDIIDYKDSAELVDKWTNEWTTGDSNSSNYNEALILLENGYLPEAYEVLVKIDSDYEKTETLLEECEKYMTYCGTWESSDYVYKSNEDDEPYYYNKRSMIIVIKIKVEHGKVVSSLEYDGDNGDLYDTYFVDEDNTDKYSSIAKFDFSTGEFCYNTLYSDGSESWATAIFNWKEYNPEVF